jgi:hypothetical protein
MIFKILLVCLDTLQRAFSYMSSSFYTSNFHVQKLVPFITYQCKLFSCGRGPWQLGQQCGCVLAGHSFGGLVIKSLVDEAYSRGQCMPRNEIGQQSVAAANRFLQNLRGVVNYAVPHNGSFLESYFAPWHNLFGQVKVAEFMEHLKAPPRQMENWSVRFDEISHEKSIFVYDFLEGKGS